MSLRKMVLMSVSLVALGTILVGALAMADEDIGGQEKEKVIAIADMPQPVQDTIHKEAAGFELRELLEVTTDRGVYYEAEWLDGEDEVSILMTPDGKIADREREKSDADDEDDDTEQDDD